MTEKELKQYKSLCKEIESLDKRIQKEQEKEVDVVAGKVKASMSEFPYTEIRVGVQMESPEQVEAQKEVIKLYLERKEMEERKKLEIEQYINGIEDSQLRLIFQYRYIDGMKVHDVGRRVGYTKGRVSQLIRKNLKD